MQDEDLVTETHSVSEADFGPIGHMLLGVSKLWSVIGGLAFVGLVGMSLVSIIGRKLYSLPVPGDMEVLQMVAASASACFFGYCHLRGGDVKVDFFTHNLGPRVTLLLDAFGSLGVGLMGALLAWRTLVGALSLREAGETSPILEWPIWVAELVMVPGFILLALAGFYMVFVSIRARGAHRVAVQS
ncbi:TRAP transporter small permease [Alcaligenaceae bacterium CGII-47]|nr:TRAP transporter small permease [Alcaligenaceae bacterium CGII-47]